MAEVRQREGGPKIDILSVSSKYVQSVRWASNDLGEVEVLEGYSDVECYNVFEKNVC